MEAMTSALTFRCRLTRCAAALVVVVAMPSVAVVERAQADISEGTFVLRAGRVYTMADGDGWIIENGMILVENGRIVAVGADIVVPLFVDMIELPDAIVMPGLVAANSSLAGRNASEDSVGPRYRAVDAFDAYADYGRILSGGVTTVYLNPGRHRLVTGVGAVAKLGAAPGAAILRETADLVINLGERVFDPPAKQQWLLPPSSDSRIEPSLVQRPSSRLGQFLQLRESFDAATSYDVGRGDGGRSGAGGKHSQYDDNLAALEGLLRDGVRLRINADRATDIEQAIQFCRERGFEFVLTGASQSELVADILARAGVGIVYEAPLRPVGARPNLGPDPDRLDDDLYIPPALRDLPIAIAGPEGEPHAQLMLYAAAARRAGLSRRAAIEAVTIHAAKLLGVDDRVGSIQPGRDADLVVLNGEPLLATTHVRRVFVNGRTVFETPEKQSAKLVVKAGTIWTGETTIKGGAVLVEDGRITAVGETVPVPPHARVIDAGPQAVVTPGFIDSRGHLGLEGDRSRVGADLSPAKALARARPEFARVARAGVTTVLVSAYRPDSKGARISAIHTAGETRDELIVKDAAGLIFSLRGTDPATAGDVLRKALKAGKAYDDAWKKYHKALAEYKAKGPEQKAAEKKKPDATEDEVKAEKPQADPVTGTWEGSVAGEPLPEPQDFTARLKLSGDQVEGSLETFFGGGEEIEVSGTFSEGHLSLEVDLDIPIGKPTIEADIDEPDHLTGTFNIGSRFSFELEAERTEKEAPEIKISRKRKKKDGEPEAPKKNEALEPYRDLFAGKIAVVIDVKGPGVIGAVLPVFQKDYKVPFILLNAEGAGQAKEQIAGAKTGVILPTRAVRRIGREDYVQSVDLTRGGIPVAFQSDAEDGARGLPDRAAYHIRLGMDATAALRALTIDAARLMRCDDQVGVLQRGCRGDLLIFDGPPLEPGSRLSRVIINGKEVGR